MQLTEDATFQVPDHVLSRRAAGETVLLSLESEDYFGLAGSGGRFWELIEDGATYGRALDALEDEYEVDRARLRADLDALVDDLLEAGLVAIDGT